MTSRSFPHLRLHLDKGVAYLDGTQLRGLRANTRTFRALVALAHAGGRIVGNTELSAVCPELGSHADPKGVARDVVRRLREGLRKAGAYAERIVESVGRRGWILRARVTFEGNTTGSKNDAPQFRGAAEENRKKKEKEKCSRWKLQQR